jgi:methionyl-tRNA synthetase
MTDSAPSQDDFIEFDDFTKVDLRVAVIKEAEKVEKSKKLLRLIVDAGEAEPRQILAGISEHYAPEDLIGRRVVIVANLKPRKLMGLESQGMVLAASDDNGLSVLGVDRDVEPGSSAK